MAVYTTQPGAVYLAVLMTRDAPGAVYPAVLMTRDAPVHSLRGCDDPESREVCNRGRGAEGQQ